MNLAEFKLLRALRMERTGDKGVLSNLAGVSYQTAVNVFNPKNNSPSPLQPYMKSEDEKTFEILPNARFFIGLSLGASTLKTIVINNVFEPVDKQGVDDAYKYLVEQHDARIENGGLCISMPKSFEQLLIIINSILEKLLALDLKYEGVGFAFSGLVKNQEQKIDVCYNVDYLNDATIDKIVGPNIFNILKEKGITICVDHNSKASAIADKELDRDLHSYRNIMSLYLGTGIGAGFILDNILYRGNRNASGQVGHIKFPAPLIGPDKKITDYGQCTCGKYGCIEQLMRQEVFGVDFEKFKETIHEVDVKKTLTDTQIKNLSMYIAYLISCLTNSLSFDIIVISGTLVQFYNKMWPHLTSYLKDYQYASIQNNTLLKESKTGIFAPAIGVAIESHYLHHDRDISW